jgi:A/G-specific adenine glycosylase
MRQTLPDDDIAIIRAALLTFYDTAARPLPWRATRDPYAIWISEVMAQQTRVETIVPYYHRWLSRFPDVATLADAADDDVLKAWEGLGYYSRVRNLHAAARLLCEHHGSTVPASYEALRALPGVGDYTAGAVSSIAFGARRAAIDGNVRRVLARLLDHSAPSSALLGQVAGALVPAERPGDFNQALMELGATICTPRSPRCGRCPIAPQCAARAAGTQQHRPRPTAKKTIPTIDIAAAVVRDRAGRLLIQRRPAHGLLAGLWAFPGIELQPGDDPAAQALLAARRHVARIGQPAKRRATGFVDVAVEPRAIGVIEHAFTHRRERYHCFLIDVNGGVMASHDIAWIDGLASPLALPRAQQRIRSLALAHAASNGVRADDRTATDL